MNHEELVIAASVAIENALRTLSDWLDKERPDKAMIKGGYMRTTVNLHECKEQPKAVHKAVSRAVLVPCPVVLW